MEISRWRAMDPRQRASLVAEKVLGGVLPGPEFDPSGDIRSTWLVVARACKFEANYWRNADEKGTWYVGIALEGTEFRRSFSGSFGDAVCVAALNAAETWAEQDASFKGLQAGFPCDQDEYSKTDIQRSVRYTGTDIAFSVQHGRIGSGIPADARPSTARRIVCGPVVRMLVGMLSPLLSAFLIGKRT